MNNYSKIMNKYSIKKLNGIFYVEGKNRESKPRKMVVKWNDEHIKNKGKNSNFKL